MTPQQKNNAAASGFMAQHGADKGHSGMADFSWFTFSKGWRGNCELFHAVGREERS